jgi:uncharacterized protein (DUF2147 family)
MKRFGYLAVLVMLMSSPADAGSISFMFHGHRVRVERPRHCFSRSCLSVSAPGLNRTHPDDIAAAPELAPVKPALPALPSAPSSSPAPVQSVIVSSPAPKSPNVEFAANPTQAAPPPRESLRPPPAEKPPVTAQVPPAATSQPAASEPADTPLGDWQSESKDLVRIEACGSALCGYMVDAATNAKGETILINMKPKMKHESATEWTGTIASHASTSYATMALKQQNTLRVEACAVGRFFCSGNDWSRIATTPQALITSRQATAQPPS